MGIRTASPLPSRRVPARCLEVGVRRHQSVRQTGSAELPVLSRSRIRAASLEVTPGSTLVDVGLADPLADRLRPEAELVCHPGDLTGLFPGLGGTLADEAHGVLVLSGGVARRRRAFRARVARPALWAVLSWLLLPPTARPSRGTSGRHRCHGPRPWPGPARPGDPRPGRRDGTDAYLGYSVGASQREGQRGVWPHPTLSWRTTGYSTDTSGCTRWTSEAGRGHHPPDGRPGPAGASPSLRPPWWPSGFTRTHRTPLPSGSKAVPVSTWSSAERAARLSAPTA